MVKEITELDKLFKVNTDIYMDIQNLEHALIRRDYGFLMANFDRYLQLNKLYAFKGINVSYVIHKLFVTKLKEVFKGTQFSLLEKLDTDNIINIVIGKDGECIPVINLQFQLVVQRLKNNIGKNLKNLPEYDDFKNLCNFIEEELYKGKTLSEIYILYKESTSTSNEYVKTLEKYNEFYNLDITSLNKENTNRLFNTLSNNRHLKYLDNLSGNSFLDILFKDIYLRKFVYNNDIYSEYLQLITLLENELKITLT